MKNGETNNREQISSLYQALLQCWNDRNAKDFAALFGTTGTVIGFDGSGMHSPLQIETELLLIFNAHKTAAYIGIIRDLFELSAGVYLLRAVAGMVPPDKQEIDPKLNTIQSLVAAKENDQYKIFLFQNTPAAFHERPELSKALTEELQLAYNSR